MKLDFDLEKVTVTEFGVGRDDGDGQTFIAVPVDADVQTALRVAQVIPMNGVIGLIFKRLCKAGLCLLVVSLALCLVAQHF